LEIALTPGQAGDCPQAEPLLERIVAASEQRLPGSKALNFGQSPAFGAVLADKGYDSNALLKYTASLKAEAVVSSKKNRKVQRPLNRKIYKDRNKVEQLFGRVYHYQRILPVMKRMHVTVYHCYTSSLRWYVL
jgi:transposase